MRVVIFALSAIVVSAAKPEKMKPKIKRPRKLVGPNDISGAGVGTCYVTCSDKCDPEGCEVFDASLNDASLGEFSCTCTDCAIGETGEGGFECDLAGLTYDENSCGGYGFDAYILGRDDCSLDGQTLSCPGSCVCESCDCNPCAAGETCFPKNGRNGGFRCK